MTVVSLPAPSRVMPFVIVKGEVQPALPAGTNTVSPSLAEARAELTSFNETLLALTTAAPIRPGEVKNTPAMTTAALRWDANLILVGRWRFYPKFVSEPISPIWDFYRLDRILEG
jgi:hypothetical protein